MRAELVGSPLLGDQAEIVVDFAYYACLFPGLTLGGILRRGFIRLPSAFGKDPAASSGGLDEEHVVFVGGERDNAGD